MDLGHFPVHFPLPPNAPLLAELLAGNGPRLGRRLRGRVVQQLLHELADSAGHLQHADVQPPAPEGEKF